MSTITPVSLTIAGADNVPKQRTNKVVFALLAPLVLINLVGFVAPIIRLAEISFRQGRTDGSMTDAYTIHNYLSFLTDSYYLKLIPSSLWLGFLVTLSTLIVSYPVALFLFHAPAKWRNLLFIMTVSPLLVSAVVRTYGWVALLGDGGVVNSILMHLHIVSAPLHLTNNFFGVYIGLVEILMPYMSLSLIAGFGRLDMSYEEAAASLGAGRFTIFWRVIFPLSLPGVFLGCLLCFVLSISSFITPALLGGGRVFLLSTEIFNQTMVQMQWPMAATISVVVLVIFSIALSGYNRIVRRAE